MPIVLKVREVWHKPVEGSAEVKVGDLVYFLCNGNGRGGHCRVLAKVTKVMRKTLECLEEGGSYKPNTVWAVHGEKESLCIVKRI